MAAFNQNLYRAFVLFDIDTRQQGQLPRLLQEGFDQVLQRPIETAPFNRTRGIQTERDWKWEAARQQWKNWGQQIVENYLTPVPCVV
jgi:hypothetical protein